MALACRSSSSTNVTHLHLVDSLVVNVPLSTNGPLVWLDGCNTESFSNVTLAQLRAPRGASPVTAPVHGAVFASGLDREVQMTDVDCTYVVGSHTWACFLLSFTPNAAAAGGGRAQGGFLPPPGGAVDAGTAPLPPPADGPAPLPGAGTATAAAAAVSIKDCRFSNNGVLTTLLDSLLETSLLQRDVAAALAAGSRQADTDCGGGSYGALVFSLAPSARSQANGSTEAAGQPLLSVHIQGSTFRSNIGGCGAALASLAPQVGYSRTLPCTVLCASYAHQ